MSEIAFQWGGPLGALVDRSTAPVHPRVLGSANLEVIDAAMFARVCAQYGGDHAFVETVKHAMVETLATLVRKELVTRTMLDVMRETADLISGVEAAENAKLQSAGASLRVTDVRLSLPEEDMDALQAMDVSAARAQMAARLAKMNGSPSAPPPQSTAMSFVPGTRVVATWTDGKTYAAEVRNFDGARYELVWEGTSTVAWVPAPNVHAQ